MTFLYIYHSKSWVMNTGNSDNLKIFSNKLRVRVNGIYIENNKLLLVRHDSIGPTDGFWSPPGGGMEYGTSASENLEREFFEETGLVVKVDELLFVHEYLNVPLHAIELFYSVVKINGKLIIGLDPEMPPDRQIITDIKFMGFQEIKQIDKVNRHQVFELCNDLEDLKKLKGYFRL